MQWEADLGFAQTLAAAELARHATLSHPTRPGSWLVRSHALVKLGEFHQAASCLREAIGILPRSAELHVQLAEVLLAQDLLEEALSEAERALAIAPDDRNVQRLSLNLLARLGTPDRLDADAVAAFSGQSWRLMCLRAKSLGSAGTVEMCDSLLEADPGNNNARCLKAIALARLGRAEEARRLISIERLIEVRELTAPPGYADERSFRAVLAREIRDNSTLGGDFNGKVPTDSLQTRLLRRPSAVAVDALLGQFRGAVEAYEAALVASGEAFALSRPRRARLDAWAVIYGSTSRQKAGVHPAGWLSGVYYVAAPRPNGANTYRGSLVIGAIEPGKHGVAPPWGSREIEPVPGRLVLFPSYIPHATTPSHSDGTRICVAFDVVDAEGPAGGRGAGPG